MRNGQGLIILLSLALGSVGWLAVLAAWWPALRSGTGIGGWNFDRFGELIPEGVLFHAVLATIIYSMITFAQRAGNGHGPPGR